MKYSIIKKGSLEVTALKVAFGAMILYTALIFIVISSNI